jgi:uncharacterized protein (TIRG00374 family)
MPEPAPSTSPRPTYTATPLPAPDDGRLPSEFDTHRLVRRALEVVLILGVLVLVVVFAPGLGEVRDHLQGAKPGWILLAIGLEFLSGVSYVLMFRPIFCPRMSWRTSWEISWSELAVGSIVPASGAGGLALGAWILHRDGMATDQIARRSVAFFLIKSSVNFVAVAVLGVLLATGIVGPHLSLWLTALPAFLAVALIAAVLIVPRFGPGRAATDADSKTRRLWLASRKALVTGTGAAVEVVRSGNVLVLIGALGYWAWDNAVLWATFQAFGVSPPITVILMGYLIGQLGGALPLPGGIGGIDGGLIGTLVVFGTPVAATVAAVFAYRLILFWLPLLVGAPAFWLLRRGLDHPDRPDLCGPATQPG